jgi:lactoylglutathione lyase
MAERTGCARPAVRRQYPPGHGQQDRIRARTSTRGERDVITQIGSTSVFVSDQDRAVDFYVNKLGFEKRSDQPMGPDAPRWIEVAPPGAQTALVIFKPSEKMSGASSYEAAVAQIGKFCSFIFEVDDMEATHQELSARGVEFTHPPSQQFWGWWATVQDPDGNQIGLHKSAA